jgi:hypothetical protein
VTGELSNGVVRLTAVNPYYPFPDPEQCTSSFTYYGNIKPGGCNTAAGTWVNDSGLSGTWAMTKACEIPDGETTSTGDWSGPRHAFRAVISDPQFGPSRDWSGRQARERDYATGVDGCWWSGSIIDPFIGVTQPNPFDLYGSNAYIDTLWWGDDPINYYGSQSKAPCHTTIYQDMQIACGASPTLTFQSYKHNTLLLEIGVTTLTYSRDGVSTGPHTYFPPQ